MTTTTLRKQKKKTGAKGQKRPIECEEPPYRVVLAQDKVFPDPYENEDLRPILMALGVHHVGHGYSVYQPPEPGARPVYLLFLKYSPLAAEQILRSRNGHNRNRNMNRVFQMVLDAEKGQFPLTGDTIVFNHEIVLNDGSHRLYFVVLSESDKVWPTVIGIAPDAFRFTDRGGRRSLTDAVTVLGKSAAAQRGGIANWMHAIDTFSIFDRRNEAPSPARGLELLSDFEPVVEDAIAFVGGYSVSVDGKKRWETPLTVPVLGAAFATFASIHPDVARYYISTIITENLGTLLETHPLYAVVKALRAIGSNTFEDDATKKAKRAYKKEEEALRQLRKKKIKKPDSRYPVEHALFAVLFNGWNKLCRKRPISKRLSPLNMVTNGRWDDGEPRYEMPDLATPTTQVIQSARTWASTQFAEDKNGAPITHQDDFERRSRVFRKRALMRLKRSADREQRLAKLEDDRIRMEQLRQKYAEAHQRIKAQRKALKEKSKQAEKNTP